MCSRGEQRHRLRLQWGSVTTDPEDILAGLDPEQRAVAQALQGPVVVLAGAGSGKTSVLVARAGWLLARGEAAADQILLLAFGRQAAQEMDERIRERLASDDITARTFHSLALHIIQQGSKKVPTISKLESDTAARHALLLKSWQKQCQEKKAQAKGWRLWLEEGGATPAFVSGHSLGEYSALVCAGVIAFADAVRLVELRGKFMQEAVPEGTGGMSAIIGLDDASIAKACEESAEGQVVSPVNFNSPGQVVIAGHKEAVERAGAACKAAGAKRALPLPVSVPSHCALMKPAADKLAIELEKIVFNAPTISVVNNVDVKCETAPEAIRNALVRQLYSPVQWTKTVEFMAAQGVEQLYEVGPGKVLTGLTKRIVDTLTASAINEPEAMSAALSQ